MRNVAPRKKVNLATLSLKNVLGGVQGDTTVYFRLKIDSTQILSSWIWTRGLIYDQFKTRSFPSCRYDRICIRVSVYHFLTLASMKSTQSQLFITKHNKTPNLRLHFKYHRWFCKQLSILVYRNFLPNSFSSTNFLLLRDLLQNHSLRPVKWDRKHERRCRLFFLTSATN